MSLPIVTLKPQSPERRAHPWVYDNEIAARPAALFTDGGLVRVHDSKGRVLGIGYANFRSKITVRYLTHRVEEVVDDAFWERRIQQALAYRQAHYSQNGQLPPAFRLVHGEADGLPGLVVDCYRDFAVVQFLALGLEPWRKAIINAIAEALPLQGIYERSDSPVRRLEGLEERTGTVWGEPPPATLEWEEDGATVLADLKTGAKTGLFLDQRENQHAAAQQARGREMLNCFSYTGLLACARPWPELRV